MIAVILGMAIASITSNDLLHVRHQVNSAVRVELARRAAKRKDILIWGKMLFPEKFALGFCPVLHDYFVETRLDPFTSEEAPRGHAKTTIRGFLIPIFQALEEPEAFNHYLNVQATEQKALALNLSIRSEFEENDELRQLYGDQTAGVKWTDGQFVLANGVVFTAVGAGQSIRGINYRSRRPDYIVVDDLFDEKDINNPEATTKKNAWFWGSLYPARAKSKRHAIKVIGTAINAEDLLAQLEKDTSVKSKTFKAVTDWDNKLTLWPELYSYDELEVERGRMGSVIFMREFQNDRRDETSSIVKRSWLADWEFDPADLDFSGLNELVFMQNRASCDPSIGKTLEADFTGLAVGYKFRAKDDDEAFTYYITELVNEHLSLNSRISLLKRIKLEEPETRPIREMRIEGIAGFKDFVAEARRRTDLPIKEISKVPDKISHLENKSHYFENGRVFISNRIPKPLRDMLVHQLTTNHPKHDDLRDAVLHLLDASKRGNRWRPV